MLERIEARWRLGHILASELAAAAEELLAAGHEAPALRELAAMRMADLRHAGRDTFESALRDLGRGGMTASEAVLVLARAFSERLLAGALAPAQAAKAIALLRWKAGPDVDEYVVPFELLDERYESLATRRVTAFMARRRLDRRVRRQARELLGE